MNLKYGPMLAKIRNASIFGFGTWSDQKPGTVTLIEECDSYYQMEMTPTELRQLAKEIEALADQVCGAMNPEGESRKP